MKDKRMAKIVAAGAVAVGMNMFASLPLAGNDLLALAAINGVACVTGDMVADRMIHFLP